MNIKLPLMVKQMLASSEVRTYHHIWHLVRSERQWNGLSDDQRTELISRGWRPPRFENENGAGLDFLFMHREMIEMVNKHLHHLQDPTYTKVEGWNPIPFDHNDAIWKMPPLWQGADRVFEWAKHPDTTEEYKRRVDTEFRNDDWLRTKTLDEVGTEMEWSIHGWMHLHWSEKTLNNPWDESVSNDWLGAPFSSHVNDVFWKLHGFIDETIEVWENANQKVADFSDAWTGAPGYLPDMEHTAEPKLLIDLDVEHKPLRIMTWKVPIIEGVNEDEIIIEELEKTDANKA